MRYTVSLALCLFAFWLLLSGHYTVFLIGSGAVVSVLVVAFAYRMKVVDAEGHPVQLGVGAITYWPWLIAEIVKSAWTVTCIICHPRLPISPTLVRFRPRQRTTAGIVTHANSITLTPGTITVSARPEEFVVHALTREGAAAVPDSEMDRRVERIERGL